MSLLHCPELELRHSPSSWEPFIPRQASPELDTSIDLLELRVRDVKSLSDPGATYKRALNHQGLVEHLNGIQDDEKRQDPLFRILFVNGHLSRPQDLVNFNDVRPSISSKTAEFLHEHLGVSPSFLAVMIRKSWELKSGNCQWVKAVPGDDGEDCIVEGWYRCSCGLKSYPSYVWYCYTKNCTTYLVNNCEYNGVQDAIVRCVEAGMANSLLRPLAVDGFIAEATSEGWGEAMRLPRLTLIKYEQFDEQNVFVDTRESVKELHVLSYNLLIIKEDMTDNIDRLEYLLDVHKTLENLFTPATPHRGIKVSHSLSFLLSENRIRQRWAECYSNRTGIQINLWYNLSSQRDNQTNLKIADFSSKIATETQKDSSSMITMAAVTMAFLPGTFVSALFSMVFFDTTTSADGRTSLSVGPTWWLFPVITIPLTILVFAIWHFWRKRRNDTQMRELKTTDELHRAQERVAPGAYTWAPNHALSNLPAITPYWETPPASYQAPASLDIFASPGSKPTPAGVHSPNAQPKREVRPAVAPEEVQERTSLDGSLKEKSVRPGGGALSLSTASHTSPWYTSPPPLPPPPSPPPLSASPRGSLYDDRPYTPGSYLPTTSPWTATSLPPLDPYSMANQPPVMTMERRRVTQKLGAGQALPPSIISGPQPVADLTRVGEAARVAERRNRERFYVRNAAMTLEDLHDERSYRTQIE